MEIVKLRLRDLQPSQFYISAGKLKAIERWLHPEDLSGFQPIPVKLLDGKPVMTDGHTRAVAASPRLSRYRGNVDCTDIPPYQNRDVGRMRLH